MGTTAAGVTKNDTELSVMRTASEEIVGIVAGDRNICYGTPSENHNVTGGMWALYLSRKLGVKVDITGSDVCWMNTLQKASRQAHWPKRDNAIDAAGYSLNAIACDHADEQNKPAPLPPAPISHTLPGIPTGWLPK